MKRLFIVLAFSLTASAAFAQLAQKPEAKETKTDFLKASQYSNTNLTYKIISAPKGTWCYDILAEGRLMIHQPSVPGLPGNEGFKTKAGATAVAKLVIEKIKKGEMPPTIELAEMKKLKAI